LKALLESQKHSASEESAPEDDVIRSQFSRSKFIRSQFLQRLKSVDKVQCTKCTTTKSAHVSATTISALCLLYKTRITTIFADIVPFVFGMNLKLFLLGQSSNQAKDQW